jgi:hypothetical protein
MDSTEKRAANTTTITDTQQKKTAQLFKIPLSDIQKNRIPFSDDPLYYSIG